MPVPYTDVPKKEQQELCSDTDGACLNLGKKISVPRDLMMEELNLLSNRGSIMFHERLKRVERFTLENIAQRHLSHLEETLQGQNATQGEKGSDCFNSESYINQPGKNSLVTTLKHMVAKKGIPSVLAPGYGGPLKEVPPEKFNVTVIPKSYQSPWEEKPIDNESLLAKISTHLPEPPYKLTPANYKCFNRAPTPFGGTAGTVRTLPLPGFEMLQAHTEPHLTWDWMCHRPNFNRTPRGWSTKYAAESPDL
ncbi:myozenin-2-like isoform X1 [Sinocyclocheilus rhinocerous]|uniref:Myozenin-2-like n=1 Tax=Sinocyclocheilus rhinocerous TaxID=307959 RepID=A0A673KTW7_9TELE|nr:PREDICTED: myozenin-2-like isoform X1 [Sinocyclocheilus rhinocerous]XP_016418250.1 PREDICTED: myozenin-2-like isoform X1 [Sinocyclocheilus rhinocerous]